MVRYPFHDFQGRGHLFFVLGLFNKVIGQPESTNEPGITGYRRMNSHVRIIFITSHSPDFGLDVESFLQCGKRGDNFWMVDRVKAEGKEAPETGIAGPIDLRGSMAGAVKHAAEPVQLRTPEVDGGGIANFRGYFAVFFGDLLLAQYRAEEGSRNQSAEDRSHGKTQNAPAFLPQIITGIRQASLRIPVAAEEVGSPFDEGPIEGFDKVEVPVEDKMIPERPEDQSGFVFLDGELGYPLLKPWVPGRSQGAIGVVFMKEVALPFDRVRGKLEKIPGYDRVSREIEGAGCQGGISRPYIAIGVPGIADDVGIICCEDSPLPVDLGPQNQQTPPVQLADKFG